jgi:hypothetical protein
MKSDKEVEIKITRRNIDFYIEKKYNVKIGEISNIKSYDVKETVRDRIYVICENCHTERYIFSYNYHNQIKKSGYYVCNKCTHIKVKETNLEKYGFICPLQNEEISKKSKNKMIELYGVDNISKLDEIKDQRKDNFKKESFKIKSKKTWLDKYGVDNPSKSDLIKEKKEKTCLNNYGVENPSQSIEIFEKSQKSGKKIKPHKCGLYYRGTYEKHFLDFCLDNEIKVTKGPRIEYYMDNKKKYYHSDFYIEKLDLICEIKSSYYYNKYKNINIQKEKYSKNVHNFLFIIDKNYEDLKSLL